MLDISLIRPEGVYLPEADAYMSFFSSIEGFECKQLAPGMAIDTDVAWHFMGTDPWFVKPKARFNIHEYGSLSIPPLPKIKDLLKRRINRRPTARVFLNTSVQTALGFNDDIPAFIRPMGISNLFLEAGKTQATSTDYDLVYCGTISPDRGIDRLLANLRSSSLRVLMIGEPEQSIYEAHQDASNITFTGRVNHDELPPVIRRARYGLSLTPNHHPFHLQDSTKTLEYCALGLPVITNQHSWTRSFEHNHSARFMYIDDTGTDLRNLTADTLAGFPFQVPDVSEHEWTRCIKRSGIADWLTELERQ